MVVMISFFYYEMSLVILWPLYFVVSVSIPFAASGTDYSTGTGA